MVLCAITASKHHCSYNPHTIRFGSAHLIWDVLEFSTYLYEIHHVTDNYTGIYITCDLIIEEKILTSQLWRQKIEDEPVNFKDVTLCDEGI